MVPDKGTFYKVSIFTIEKKTGSEMIKKGTPISQSESIGNRNLFTLYSAKTVTTEVDKRTQNDSISRGQSKPTPV